MARIRLHYVTTDVDRHGNVRYYFRKRGVATKIRLPGQPGSAEFMAAYQAALNGHSLPVVNQKRTVERGSLTWLVQQYFASGEFRHDLGGRTQTSRRRYLETILAEPISSDDVRPIGMLPFAEMPSGVVRRLRDQKAGTPEVANAWLKSLKVLFSWAVDAELAELNPTLSVKKLERKGEGWHAWTEEEVLQFEDHFPVGTRARLALALLIYTGQRRQDVVLFGRQHIRDNCLCFTQNKNRERKPQTLRIPLLPVLARIIEATPSEGLTFLLSKRGAPYSGDRFGKQFKEWCVEADLPHCCVHGLRKAAAERIAENGATVNQMMAIFGWRDPRMAIFYTQRAEQRRLAAAAMPLLELGRKRTT